MSYTLKKESTRTAVSILFFLHGLCFSSWASRIPHIQQHLGLNDGQWGLFLFFIPVGDLCTMPISSWLVHQYGSKRFTIISLVLYASTLSLLGIVHDVAMLCVGLFLFGATSNLVNICVNTQSLLIQKCYQTSILAMFHGMWSLAGFVGAAFGMLLIALGISFKWHFFIVATIIVICSVFLNHYLINGNNVDTNRPKSSWPNQTLFFLGILACFCFICEGTMFDWSGVYFRKVIHAPDRLVGVGYATFMSTMALGRFLSDGFINRWGPRIVLVLSGSSIAFGISLALLLPNIISSTIGFAFVGIGVASIVPIIYAEAGRSGRFSPPIAVAIVSTVGFVGFLGGPPFIGALSVWYGLEKALYMLVIAGVCIALIGSRIIKD